METLITLLTVLTALSAAAAFGFTLVAIWLTLTDTWWR